MQQNILTLTEALPSIAPTTIADSDAASQMLKNFATSVVRVAEWYGIGVSEQVLNDFLSHLRYAQPVDVFGDAYAVNALCQLSAEVVKNPSQMPVGPNTPVIERRPDVLECDVVRFQNNKEKWVAFVGLYQGHPYEIFTGLQDDEEGIVLPKTVTKGRIIKTICSDGTKRYDFQFQNKRGYKTTVEGLSGRFNKEYWNYAKLISGVLRYRMPIENVIKLVNSLQLESESINTWKVGVSRALKKYVADGTDISSARAAETDELETAEE